MTYVRKGPIVILENAEQTPLAYGSMVYRDTRWVMGERDDTLLDVTLGRDGHARRWVISRSGDAWIYRSYGPNTASVDGSYKREHAIARKREWEAEIAAAKADGWI